MDHQLYQIQENGTERAEGALLLTDRTLGAWYAGAEAITGENAPFPEAYCTVSGESHAALEAHLSRGETGDMLIATAHGTLLVLCGLYASTGLIPVVLPPAEIAALLAEPADLAPTLHGVTLCPACRRFVCYHTDAEHTRVREWYATLTSLFLCDAGDVALDDLAPRLTALAEYFGCTLACEAFDGAETVDAPISVAALLLALVLCRQAGGHTLSVRWRSEGTEEITMCTVVPGQEREAPAFPERLLAYANERGAILELYTPWETPHLLALNVTVSSVQRSLQGIKQPTFL